MECCTCVSEKKILTTEVDNHVFKIGLECLSCGVIEGIPPVVIKQGGLDNPDINLKTQTGST